jgi:hypothetical protein
MGILFSAFAWTYALAQIHGAVEVVDHGADGQQRKNADAPPGAAHGDGRLGGL